MSNVNVNRVRTDLEDNKATNRYQPTSTDYKGIATVFVAIFGLLTIIWAITLFVTAVGCGLGSTTLCGDFHTVLWLYLYLIGGSVALSILFAVPFL